jgi:hypothetical protein
LNVVLLYVVKELYTARVLEKVALLATNNGARIDVELQRVVFPATAKFFCTSTLLLKMATPDVFNVFEIVTAPLNALVPVTCKLLLTDTLLITVRMPETLALFENETGPSTKRLLDNVAFDRTIKSLTTTLLEKLAFPTLLRVLLIDTLFLTDKSVPTDTVLQNVAAA